MTASLYSPWGPQNLPVRSPLVIVEGDTFQFPKQRTVTVIPVRCKTDPMAFRLRILPQFDASPSPAAGNSRGGRSLIGRSLPASFSRGPFGRNQFLGAFQAPRTSSRIHALQKPMRGLAKCFQVLSWLFAHDEQSARRSFVSVKKAFGEVTND